MLDTVTNGHEKGFEREATLMSLHSQVTEYLYKWKDFMTVARILNPELSANAFDRKPCKRKLLYIGDLHDFFIKDKVYESITFNGATYTIEGYEDGASTIGCAHFQQIS